MAQETPFRHQAYRSTPPTSPHCLVSPPSDPPAGSDAFRRRLQQVGAALRRADVAAVYLAHGSFMGPDALGIIAELARALPSAGEPGRRIIKRIVDRLAGEVGNYTAEYARCFESCINGPGEPFIPVRIFHWSSENHHIGRADGAVRLIDELAAMKLHAGQRVLLWGHSHAGNVFALATNLLAHDREAVERFFAAAEIYYRWPLLKCVDIPVWERVRCLLQGTSPLDNVATDVVTFGTPIRYGWNADGYARLLHFIHHRPADGVPDYRAAFPPRLQDVVKGTHGDYIQQLGIAGTNTVPSILAWRAWMADQRLNRLLQDDTSVGGPLERFEAGAIVPDEGTTLLVDYGLPSGGIAQRLAGHAVYTRKRWLLFHAEEVARRFYQYETA
jgi:hypothetical protein